MLDRKHDDRYQDRYEEIYGDRYKDRDEDRYQDRYEDRYQDYRAYVCIALAGPFLEVMNEIEKYIKSRQYLIPELAELVMHYVAGPPSSRNWLNNVTFADK
jgi:hypothetical protein